VFFYVVGDENWRSKSNVSKTHSDLAVTPALIGPSSPCAVRINEPVTVRHERFFDTEGSYAQFAEMLSPIEFNRFPSQQFYPFN